MNESKCKCGDDDQEFWDAACVAAFQCFVKDPPLRKQDETYAQAASRVSADYADAALAERNKRMGAKNA